MTIGAVEQDHRLTYRRGVGVVLINPNQLVFAAERRDTPGSWQMPQGGIDDKEDPETAAKRELAEETGLPDAQWTARSTPWLRYDFPADLRDKLWQKKFWHNVAGQEQKWYLAHMSLPDSAINLEAQNPPEFINWTWMKPAELIDQIVDFKRTMYREIFHQFSLL